MYSIMLRGALYLRKTLADISKKYIKNILLKNHDMQMSCID